MSKKQTKPAYETGEALVKLFSVLGDVNGRKMFGGYGIFIEGAMFALVTSDNVFHLKVDDSNRAKYAASAAAQFQNMPYYQPPTHILQNDDALLAWAKESMAVASASKKKQK